LIYRKRITRAQSISFRILGFCGKTGSTWNKSTWYYV